MFNNQGKYKIGSICCGLGGFDIGAQKCGFETVWAVDIKDYACKSFKKGFPNANVINKDAHLIEDFSKFGEIDGLVFGPPCQGFSTANTNRRVDDKRNSVYKATLKAIEQTNSKFFIFENVKGILSMKNDDGSSFFDVVLKDYENCGQGYNLTFKLIDCVKVGVPQENRFRVIIVGIRKDINLTYKFAKEEYGPGKKPFVTLRDTIYHLRNVNQKGMYDESGFSPRYLGRNRQKGWDEPAYTVEASGRHAKLHPDGGKMVKIGKDAKGQPIWHIPDTCRKLSTLESKLLQTIPEDYYISGNMAKQYEQIGNAVPGYQNLHILTQAMNNSIFI